MKRLRGDLAQADDGAAAVEFVVAAPFLIMLLAGIFQVGMLFLANAGLQQAVESGARYATLYPRPTAEQISSRVMESGYGLRPTGIEGPAISYGETDGTPYADISMSYSMRLDFVFFQSAPIELVHTRRAYQT
jgi:Flp pilus assembly protein TadG